MKTVTNEFKEQITKLGREIDFKFFLHTNDKILTEDGKFLMTEDNRHLVVEQFDDVEVDEVINAEDIYRVSIVNRGKLLSTMMKELDFEVSKDLRIGDVIGCNFGLKVNGDYEYIDYGNYMVYEKEFNEDTKTYSYKAYDRMLLTMQEVSQEFLDSLEGQTLATSLNWICGIVGLSYNATQQELADYPNLSKEINEGTFTGMQMTYRDVLDMIAQALGLSMIVEGNYLRLKPLNDTPVATINEQSLKDTNVSFGEKYMINSVVLSRSEDNDNIYRRDEESVAEYGVHEYKIKDNLIMLYDDREDYIDEIFEQLNGLEYYINDFTSTGITYLDWLDFYNVEIGDKTYKCLMLNDEINIDQGLEESIYSEMPEETVTNYKTSSKTDKEVSFIVDKQNGKISGKVSQDDIIASLNVAVEDGQGIVELKGNSVIIESDNFKLDTEGNAELSGKITSSEGVIGSFTIGQLGLYAHVQDKYTYTLDDAQRVRDIIMGTVTPTEEDYERLDVNNDGLINALDYTGILRKYYGYASTEGDVTLSTEDADRILYFEGNGSVDEDTSIGIGHITTSSFTGNNFNTIGGATNIDNNGITTPTVTQTSKEENKKDFELLESGLEIINNIDIYKYHLKTQEDDEKKHIGFVIGNDFNYSEEITSSNNDGVDTYSFISVCCKAIQEQQEQINSLKEQIKQLKESDK